MACLVHRNSAEFEVLALFERLNSHSFQWLRPWTPVGVLSARPQTPQLCLLRPSDAMFPRMENTTIFTPVLLTVLKHKKALTAILVKKLCFKRLRQNYLNRQKKQTEKERLRLVISTFRVGVTDKTDDEIYVSSILKMHSYFSFFFSTVPKKVQLLKISKVMQLL